MLTMQYEHMSTVILYDPEVPLGGLDI